MRRLVLLLAGGLLASAPALVQAAVPHSALRALNLARNTAVQLNGGLRVYRPAQCMFETADVENPCLIANDGNGYTFRFLGGAPGWQALNQPATRETEIQVAPNGRTVTRVIYNGAPR